MKTHLKLMFRAQSKKASLMEAMTNTLVGLCIAFCMNVILYKAYHIPVTSSQTFAITMWMTLVSVIRSYVLRRLWNSEWWKRWKFTRTNYISMESLSPRRRK